jgi:hypothetical protein
MAKYNVKDSTFVTGAAGGAPSTVVGQVASGSIEAGEASLVDVTTVGDATKQRVRGVKESLSGSIELVWDPAETSHASLMSSYLAKTLISVGFILKNGASATSTLYSNGYITNVSAPIEVDGAMSCTISFKGTGDVSLS